MVSPRGAIIRFEAIKHIRIPSALPTLDGLDERVRKEWMRHELCHPSMDFLMLS